jgi:hypothetical protein
MLFIFNDKTHFITCSGIFVAYNYRNRPQTLVKLKSCFLG